MQSWARSATVPDEQLEPTLAALRESETRFYRLAENAPDVIFHLELLPQRRVSFVNAAVTRITGYTPEQFYGDPALAERLIHPDDVPLVRAGSHQPVRSFHKDGHLVYLECYTAPIPGDGGAPIAIEVVARDVTPRLLAEAAARRAQERLSEQATHLARLQARDQLAGELNDGAIQSLYGIMLQLEGEARRASSHDTAEALRAISDQVGAVIDEIRTHLIAAGREIAEHPQAA